MGPVAVQSIWSLRAGGDESELVAAPRAMTPEERKASMRFNIDTCHVWAADGEMVAAVETSGDIPIPVWAERRLLELGRDPDEWRQRMRG